MMGGGLPPLVVHAIVTTVLASTCPSMSPRSEGAPGGSVSIKTILLFL